MAEKSLAQELAVLFADFVEFGVDDYLAVGLLRIILEEVFVVAFGRVEDVEFSDFSDYGVGPKYLCRL